MGPNSARLLHSPPVKLTFDQAMILLAGLTAGCDRSSPEIVPEGRQTTALAASAAPEAAQTPTASPPPNPPKAAPTASTVVAKELTPAPKPRSGAPAGSASTKQMACAPGGCAPGKCG